jgi:hypothetical protein
VPPRWCRFALVLTACLLSAPAARAQDAVSAEISAAPAATTVPAAPNFWKAAAGVAAVNWVTWAFNWYIQQWPWARVDLESWALNLRQGLAWDNDSFRDNQFLHPYHGTFYHHSARANGFGFWGSLAFVAAGSATWEFFGENIIASPNDLIMTTLGGVALGEVTFRLSRAAGSRGGGRYAFGRHLGAFALSPMASAQRLMDSRSDLLGTPPEAPPGEPAVLALGQRSSHPFLELKLHYGNPLAEGSLRPYDAFEFRLVMSPDGGELFQHVGISGLLARSLGGSTGNRVAVGLYQHYDYDNFPNLKFGGNSLSAALLYQWPLGSRNQLNLSTHAEAILLGGISSDQGLWWRRDYDMGPGVGARVGASFVRDGREWLRFDGRLAWLHSVHGSDGNHLASFLRMGAAIPLVGPVGLGGDLAIATRHSSYPGFPSVDQRVPQVRAYLTWVPF